MSHEKETPDDKMVLVWEKHPDSLLITRTGERLRQVRGRQVTGESSHVAYVITDTGELINREGVHGHPDDILPEMADITELLRRDWLEDMLRDVDYVNPYEARSRERRAFYQERARKIRHEGRLLSAKADAMIESLPFEAFMRGAGEEGAAPGRMLSEEEKAYHERFLACERKAAYFERKARGNGRLFISSDDPQVLRKLRVQLKARLQKQLLMKAANLIYRSRKSGEEKMEALMLAGMPEYEAMLAVYRQKGGKAFPSGVLQRNNTQIIRLRNRIADTASLKHICTDAREDHDGFSFVTDCDDNRFMFIFADKPDEAVCALLKAHAFKWSVRKKAWVRKITRKALDSAEAVKMTLLEIYGQETQRPPRR